MYRAFSPAFQGSTADSDLRGFGSGLDMMHHFAREKNAAMGSPLTDSLGDDLSSSSGAMLRGSAPLLNLAPSSTSSTANLANAHGAPSHIGSPGAGTHTPANSTAFGGGGGGSPLFHFFGAPGTEAAASRPVVKEDDNGLLNYAGLESLLMTAVGEGSNAPTPTLPSSTKGLSGAHTAAGQLSAGSTGCGAPPATATAAAVREGPPTTHRSSDSISALASRGSPSLGVGGGSPNMYSGENALLYANFGPEFTGGLPNPRILSTHVDTVDAKSPLPLASHPVSTPCNPSTHARNACDNSNRNGSQSAVSNVTGGNTSAASMSMDAEVRSNLFICGLPVTVTDADLNDLFGKFGPIDSAKVMLDIHSGRSRGIAFVKFSDVEHAENAADSLNGTSVNGHLISVRVANSRAAYLPGNPTNKTFVRNVPPTVPRATLMSYFSQFGAVTDLSVMSDTAPGRHRHQGASITVPHPATAAAPVSSGEAGGDKLNIVFITYETKEAAAAAAEATHTKMPFKECNGVPLLAKVAEDTTRRMERLSRRVRGGADVDAKAASSTAPASTLSYGSAPTSVSEQMRPSQQASLTAMPSMMPASASASMGGYPGGAYVAVQNMPGTDLSSLMLAPANMAGGNPYQPQFQQHQPPQPQQMSVFRDANGNIMYAATAAPALAQMTYPRPQVAAPRQQQQQMFYYATQALQPQHLLPPPPPLQQPQQTVYIQTPDGLMAAQPHQFHMLSQQQQQMHAPQGQVLYMQMANGSVVPVMYGGAPTAQPQGAPPR